jgi:hypothetical protein
MSYLDNKIVERRLPNALGSVRRLFHLLGSISDDGRVSLLHDDAKRMFRRIQRAHRSFGAVNRIRGTLYVSLASWPELSITGGQFADLRGPNATSTPPEKLTRCDFKTSLQ